MGRVEIGADVTDGVWTPMITFIPNEGNMKIQFIAKKIKFYTDEEARKFARIIQGILDGPRTDSVEHI